MKLIYSSIIHGTFAALLFLAVLPVPLAAQDTSGGGKAAGGSAAADDEYRDYGEDSGITITGETRSPTEPVSSPYGAHNVVDEEHIRKQGSQDLLDTLRNVPGVTTSKRNAAGTNTAPSLYIRGRGYRHPALETVTSFDGVPRNGAVWGQSMADAFPVFAAGSVEVYKSPQPSSFGAGLGLVNVTPKYQNAEGWEFNSGFNAGSFSTFSENVGFGYKKGRVDVFAAQSWLVTSGHVYHSGAQQQSYYANAGFWFNPNWNVRALANYVSSWTDQPPSGTWSGKPPLMRYETESLLATATVSNVFKKAAGYIKFYYDDMTFTMLHENEADNYSKQPITTSGVRLKETLWLWDNSEIIAGFDLDKTRAANEQYLITTTPDRPSVFGQFPDMTLYSPYIAGTYTFGSHKSFYAAPQAGIRGYIHDRFDSKAAPQAGLVLGYKALSLQANYALGVVYPPPSALNSIVYAANVQYSDNQLKEVKPEVTHHFEAGISYTQKYTFNIGASFFYDNSTNRLLFAKGGGGIPVTASLAQITTYGIEAYAGLEAVKNLDVWIGAMYLLNTSSTGEDGEAVHNTDEDDNVIDAVPFTPKISVSAGVEYTLLKRIVLSANYQYTGGLYYGNLMFDAFSTVLTRLPDQHLLNARAAFRINYKPWNIESAETFVLVNNILNHQYEYYPGYTMPGLNITAGLAFKFK
ncbi:MAG: TonB-dependent receptor plug domain-containing protein [Spirochaetaceae bacterium]|jgi:iron complex outermembrane receptor protein|nr:TonB-dependent receptor plug domain-containing protein [Spirochaetaceae bacterium]